MGKRGTKKSKDGSKLSLVKMYDYLLANLLSGTSIIEPTINLTDRDISVGYNTVASKSEISKYYVITHYPDWLSMNFLDRLRYECINDGVRIDYYIYGEGHQINWGSSEMAYKMRLWREYTDSVADKDNINVFEYREKRSDSLSKDRIISSTKYFNEADLDYRRKTLKVTIVIKVTGTRDDLGILNLTNSLTSLKGYMSSNDVKIKELRVNLIDWLRYFSPFSLSNILEIGKGINKKVITDDILANLTSYKQGMLGERGIYLGVDVLSNTPVLKKFKEHPDAAENWLVSAETGGGKSYFVKNLLMNLLADNFVGMVMDYEGDEYTNFAHYLASSNRDDVQIVSLGKNDAVYYDPMAIPELPVDCDIYGELKDMAVNNTLSLFRILVAEGGTTSKVEDTIISEAIKRVYESVLVTDDISTWHRSKGLRIILVYNELKDMLESKEFENSRGNADKHIALQKIVDNCSIYFEDGESKANTFKNPLSAMDLYTARLIVFSFGMRGATSDQIDPVVLALKQLSVAMISINISNYCKYVRKCFNVKVFEEYQRWGDVKGSAEIIGNAMTGGRKRGDVNIIISNDLSGLLDDSNAINTKLRQNIQYYAIGKVTDVDVLKKFCDKFNLRIDEALLKLSSNTGMGRYHKAFCLVMGDKKTIVQVRLADEIANSKLFRTGVEVGV